MLKTLRIESGSRSVFLAKAGSEQHVFLLGLANRGILDRFSYDTEADADAGYPVYVLTDYGGRQCARYGVDL